MHSINFGLRGHSKHFCPGSPEISKDVLDSATLRPVVKVLYLEAVRDFPAWVAGVWGIIETRLCARHQDHP